MRRAGRVGSARALVTAIGVAALALAGACSADQGTPDAASSAHGSHADHAMAPPPAPAGAPAPTRHLGPQGRVGQFVTDCGYSHSAPDDPIVHPGRPGYSHMHDFFGNTGTDAFSTLDSLLGAGTTCQTKADTAAYWAPRLLDRGEPVRPNVSTAYYRAAPRVDPAAVQPFPAGLRVVAGDMTADAGRPQDTDLAGWACGTSTRHSSAPPNCPGSAPLRAVITFPDCWDGTDLDSPDHRSHMANSRDGECPPSHPVHVPQLTFAVTYPIAGPDHDLTLASGEVQGVHADFVNAWDEAGLANEVETCLNRQVVCGLSSNRGEEPLFSG